MEDRVEEVIKIFKQIQSTSSTNEKKAIIAANALQKEKQLNN